jgi:uncharacterized membrane protein YkoI
MKNKMIGILIGIGVVLGGAFVAMASNGADDNLNANNEAVPANGKVVENVELETEHGETSFKVETDDSNSIPVNINANAISIEEATKIATAKVMGKVTKVEKEMEQGRLEYKFEIQTSNGESDVRVDAETGEITRIKHDNK